jgi:hypothetical protein
MGSLKWLAVRTISAETLNCKLPPTGTAGISICTLQDVIKITNGQLWQNSIQNFVI